MRSQRYMLCILDYCINCVIQDGTADVYISGMANRNRALNGDIVAVMVQDRDNWRVRQTPDNHCTVTV